LNGKINNDYNQFKITTKNQIDVLIRRCRNRCFILKQKSNESESPKTAEAKKILTPLICRAAGQIDEYLKGQRKNFELQPETEGTEFQKRVWHAMQTIP
jgi:O6-methylguanine-DNA--protein-cysteine methyltransferase